MRVTLLGFLAILGIMAVLVYIAYRLCPMSEEVGPSQANPGPWGMS